MRHASLFSGIGGPEVAAAMLGWENVFHCEINEFGRRVLDYWFPDSDSYEDITKTDFTKYRGTIDVLTGGFPCQPFSYAGKRGGQADDRYLWPEMLRVIEEVRPTWVVGENVAGIATMVEQCRIVEVGSEAPLFEEADRVYRYTAESTFTIERVCSDLESKGYAVQPMLIPACAVGAPHRRDRIFFIAYNVADSINERGVRESSTNATKEGKERICERNQVQWTDESADVRSESERIVADTFSGRGDAHEESEGIERGWCEANEQPGKWREQAEWDNGLSRISRSASDSENLQRDGCSVGHRGSSEREKISEFGNSDCKNVTHAESEQGYRGGFEESETCGTRQKQSRRRSCEMFTGLRPGERWKAFPSVSAVHRGNDGLPFDVDNLTIPFSKWRTESLKAYGNAIVPQVMYSIFEAIEAVEAKR